MGGLRSMIGVCVGGLGCITKHVNKCAPLKPTQGFDASFMASDRIPRRSSHILVPLIIQHVYPGNTHIREHSEKLQQEVGVTHTVIRPDRFEMFPKVWICSDLREASNSVCMFMIHGGTENNQQFTLISSRKFPLSAGLGYFVVQSKKKVPKSVLDKRHMQPERNSC